MRVALGAGCMNEFGVSAGRRLLNEGSRSGTAEDRILLSLEFS